LKIAVNTRFLLKNKLEGIGRFTYETMQRLAVAHPEHEFIFLFDRPYDASFIFSKNVTPVVLFPQARHPILFVWWFEWSVVQALKKYEADVFISPDNFLSLRTEVPTVLVVHDIAFVHFTDSDKWINRLYYRFFMPRFLKKAKHILTVSEFTKQDIIEHFNIEKDKITVCYNGCRKGFYPLSIDTLQSDYFIYMGAVHPRKNVHHLVEAFDLFKKKHKTPLKLMICGRFAWQTGAVKSAYDAAEYKNDIIFKGYVNDDEAVKLMQGALGLVYVSNFEGFGIPLLEAMHCNIPIITSNTSSMPEVVGDAAILVNPESVEEIAHALSELAFNDELRHFLIEKGRIQRTKFSWEKTAQVLINKTLDI
jgi:glycosyltransferase involved in cell wall biosynthesis